MLGGESYIREHVQCHLAQRGMGGIGCRDPWRDEDRLRGIREEFSMVDEQMKGIARRYELIAYPSDCTRYVMREVLYVLDPSRSSDEVSGISVNEFQYR